MPNLDQSIEFIAVIDYRITYQIVGHIEACIQVKTLNSTNYIYTLEEKFAIHIIYTQSRGIYTV